MFDVIVWATDGSPAANDAFPLARELAKTSGAKLIVAHVDELVRARGGYHTHADEEQLLDAIRRQVSEMRDEGIDAELQIATMSTGGAADVIAEVAQSAGADLIVAGTRGHGRIAGLLLGSVMHRLLHIAHCPVLAVPAQQDELPTS
jgi:nucleotide-binding universal stress UspA family protein